MLRLSLIIVNFNGRNFVQPCIDTILASSLQELEVILVDNCSADGSPEFVERGYPKVKVVKNYSSVSLLHVLPAYLALLLGEFLAFISLQKLRLSMADGKAFIWNQVFVRYAYYTEKIQCSLNVSDIKALMVKGSMKLRIFRIILNGKEQLGWT